MKQEHIILMRKGGSATRDPFSGPMFEMSEGPFANKHDYKIDIAIEAIEKREVASLRNDPMVQSLAPTMPMKLVAPVNPDGTESDHQGDAWGIEAVRASSSPYTGKGIKVAILDTGIDESHPAFEGMNLIKRNFTEESEHDENGHGTHVAGSVFGRDVDGARIGIAREIETAIIGKVLGVGGGSTAKIYQAILWASQQGASIVSMSLGIDFPGYVKQLVDLDYPADLATSRALEGYRANILLYEQLAGLLRVQGSFMNSTTIVAAAGNESRRDEHNDYEIAVAPPAASEGVLSVGALAKTEEGLAIADFSNTGPNVSAPGADVLSAKVGGGLVSFDGTSMATPYVSGVMALWAQKMKEEGEFNQQSLIAKVIGNATRLPLVDDHDPFDVGVGIVQAPQN